MIPGGSLDLMRSSPQMSDVYLIIQQPELWTSDLYSSPYWDDYLWSCRINVAPTGDPVVQLSVNTGGASVSLLDGMTVMISGSQYGEWDKAIIRLRGDQNVVPATTTLNIATSSDIAGRVSSGDYVVVLDEFRLWQRYGRIDYVAGGALTWYKDYSILWDATGANDTDRRLASMPPVPIMGPHAVKFVDTPNVGASFWFDWSDSYDLAVGEAVDTWHSHGVQDHAYNTWTSNAQVPGWQAVNAISGLKGFRVWLEVNDGKGVAATLPFRRGVRYVFTVRRPGDTQAGDPVNAEAIKDFRLNSDISGSYNTGYWSTSITLYGEAASKYEVIPGALVIVFADDYYQQDSPYLSPSGIMNTSVGPVADRENILFVGRIVDGTITKNDEIEEVSFTVESVAEEASRYDNYPIVIEDDLYAEDWIDTPSLTVDRAVRYYIAWHTTLSLIADVYPTGDSHTLFAQDFVGGTIYNTLDSFLRDRLFARLLCDKYGTLRCEVDTQMQPYGSVPTLWNLADCDWLDSLTIKRFEYSRVKAVEVGGIVYYAGAIVPKLSRAPGLFDKYRGTLNVSNSLAILDQDELNVLSGRFLEYSNYEWDMTMALAGNWRYLDISPQSAVNIQSMTTHRGIMDGRAIIREVRNAHNPDAGVIFTSIKTESESTDGVPGITVDIPEDLPDIPLPDFGLPTWPVMPTDPVVDLGRRMFSTNVGIIICDNIGAVSPHYSTVNSGFLTADDMYGYRMKRDPFHSWNEVSYADRRLYVGTKTGIWVQYGFPYGTW